MWLRGDEMEIERISKIFDEYNKSKMMELSNSLDSLTSIKIYSEINGAKELVIKILEEVNANMKDELSRLQDYSKWVETA
jgi:hypothetical protein